MKHQPSFAAAVLVGLLCVSAAVFARAAQQPEARDEERNPEREILYWVAPMDPNFRRDKPGKSPMGMDLVPVYADQVGPQVTISPAVVQNLGVRTAEAEIGTLWRRIDTVGYVVPDEERISYVHPRVDGWIEMLGVRAEGERVLRGQPLYELYSPALVAAQEEYLQVLASRDVALQRASARRLGAMGMSPEQIASLRDRRTVRDRVAFRAEREGIVEQLKVREGQYVRPDTTIMTILDLSTVWVIAEVFEAHAGWVEVGQPARMRLSYLPGKSWEGAVAYVYPTLDPRTRTLRARLRFDNPDGHLKPNMYASVTLHASPKRQALSVPREALIRTGTAERVIVALGEGRFAARDVEAGLESDGRVEILEGLEAGERVVVSGQFLIDSEASLNASMRRLEEPGSAQPAGDLAPPDVPGHEPGASHHGRGVIRAMDRDRGVLTLEHEAIDTLGWPAMTMEFRVAGGVTLAALAEGQTVVFSVRRADDGWEIDSVRPAAQ